MRDDDSDGPVGIDRASFEALYLAHFDRLHRARRALRRVIQVPENFAQYRKGVIMVIHRDALPRHDVLNIGVYWHAQRTHRTEVVTSNVCHARN